MKKKIIGIIPLLCILLFTGCDDKPDIQQAYDFSLTSWYLQKGIKPGEEVEIRFYLNREGNYKDASYKIGYVQLEGNGRVYDTNRRILTNREPYELTAVPGLDDSNPTRQVYTLYYRATSEKRSDLRFFVIDNFEQERELLVTFNIDSSESSGEE